MYKPLPQCPFFQRSDRVHRVVCEGIVEESTVQLYFPKTEDYAKQYRLFCCRHWRNCEVYGMLMKKYEEEE